ncbi:MAG: hypothetical protein ACFFDN_01375 [Candidatus Hodarchaeota archaeon]
MIKKKTSKKTVNKPNKRLSSEKTQNNKTKKKTHHKRNEEVLQSLIFDPEFFYTKKSVRNFINKHNFDILKYLKYPINLCDGFFRVRQKEPHKFKKFRKKQLMIKNKKIKGVWGVYGFPK